MFGLKRLSTIKGQSPKRSRKERTWACYNYLSTSEQARVRQKYKAPWRGYLYSVNKAGHIFGGTRKVDRR